jgi:F-type H+-transporting ATPase subunit b
MELVTPGIGLIFWMTVSFVILLLILKKFAWKPVLKMLKEREETIENALDSAEKAREEAKFLAEQNKEMLRKNNEQYFNLLNDMEKLRMQKMHEMEEDINKKAELMMQKTQERIDNERKLAIVELKKDMVELSVEIASKILREQLQSDQKAVNFARSLVDDMQLN